MTRQLRDREGKYRHSLERLCKCGHTNGDHSSERVKVNDRWVQECFCEEGCDCECFTSPIHKDPQP
jgi:hypothetical protein